MTTVQRIALLSAACLLVAMVGHVAITELHATSRCSLYPFSAGLGAAGFHILGVTTGDTVLAGPGDVRPSRHGGHWGRGEPREVYGQLVRVTRFDAAAAGEFPADLAGGEIILVPWDYDPACEPVHWSRSAAWVEPGLEGFYSLRLRPRRQWIDGRPVADVFTADISPYPHAPFFLAGYRGTRALRERPSLSAAEYYSLHAALPTSDEAREASSAAVERLEQWVMENPDLALRYPADELIAGARRRLGATDRQSMSDRPAGSMAQSQNPSPMAETTRAHERLTRVEVSGTADSTTAPGGGAVRILVPDRAAQSGALLVIHFHGAAWIPEQSVAGLPIAAVSAVLNLGAGSGVYDRAFSVP
jgi:hypothetical protein